MDQRGALVGRGLLAASQVGLGGGEPHLRPLELALDLVQPVASGVDVGPRDLQVVTGRPQLGARPAQRGSRPRGLLARLVEVGLRVLDGVLGLALLVTQMLDVGVGQRGGGGAQDERSGRAGHGQASTGGDGEESHR